MNPDHPYRLSWKQLSPDERARLVASRIARLADPETIEVTKALGWAYRRRQTQKARLEAFLAWRSAHPKTSHA